MSTPYPQECQLHSHEARRLLTGNSHGSCQPGSAHVSQLLPGETGRYEHHQINDQYILTLEYLKLQVVLTRRTALTSSELHRIQHVGAGQE